MIKKMQEVGEKLVTQPNRFVTLPTIGNLATEFALPTLGDIASKVFKEIEESQKKEVRLLAAAAVEHQEKCELDASVFLGFYWGTDDKNHCMDIQGMANWLNENQPLDRWFFIHLIELASEKALTLGYSQYKSEIAKGKNSGARNWVVEQWKSRTDRAQSKASFGIQYASLVKKQFGLTVTGNTISRDWLPKSAK